MTYGSAGDEPNDPTLQFYFGGQEVDQVMVISKSRFAGQHFTDICSRSKQRGGNKRQLWIQWDHLMGWLCLQVIFHSVPGLIHQDMMIPQQTPPSKTSVWLPRLSVSHCTTINWLPPTPPFQLDDFGNQNLWDPLH